MHLRVLLLTIFLLACKKGDRDTQSHSTDLQIVSRGAEPRRQLHYKLAKGQTQKLDVAVDMNITAGDMGGALPTIVMSLSVSVEDVLPVGAKLRATVVDMRAVDRDETRVAANALTGPLEMMKGIVLTATLTPNGRTFGTKLDTGDKQLPDTAKAQLAALASSFDQLMMPLPDVAIGVGAVWRTSKPIEQNAMKLTAVNSVELTALDGDTLSFALDTEIHGDDQTVTQAGMTVEIKDIIGTGTGKGSIDLRTLAITNELTTQFRSEMQTPGEPAATPMRMDMTMRVSPPSATSDAAQAAPSTDASSQGSQAAPSGDAPGEGSQAAPSTEAPADGSQAAP